MAGFENVEVGDTVKFGSYEQDADTANGKEAIEWYVIDKQGDKVLLLSKYILDSKEYNEKYDYVTWETCTLRNWLNNDFYNTAFTSTEKGYIRQVTLDNPDNPYHGTEGGNATKDRVFLLSLDELRKYFSFGKDHGTWWEYNGDTRLKAGFTRQVGKIWGYSDADWSPDYTGCWWLRSPGSHGFLAAVVSSGGVAGLYGTDVFYSRGGVRPALWLNLNP